MTTDRILRSALAALALTLALAPAVPAATITIVNNDGAGEGFNDPTVVAPVGGNPGTTLGQQRLFVFQYAANIWGSILPSAVQIDVRSAFNPLTCSATSAVLGSTGATTVHANFAGADFPNTWYVQSLANKLAGADLSAAQPDMNAQFNSTLDGGTCLGGARWYYGIDGNEGANVELLPVVLHELAHGLGFATTTSGTTGNFLGTSPNQFPSIYDHYLFGSVTGLHWDQMTPAQRVASAISLDKLQWDGFWATSAASTFLAPRKRVLVSAPAGIAGSYAANVAAFGPQSYSVSGDVVLFDDGTAPNSDACTAAINAGALAGKIALIDRGTCTFVVKAQFAQAAGAIAVIFANNAAGALTPGGADPSITIPCVGITQADGTTLKTALLTDVVTVTLDNDPVLKAGADPSGRPLMYAPNPFQSGSSVSHWDTSLLPNALMEPAINNDLHDNVDITTALFKDIGWFPFVTATTLATFTAEGREDGVRLRWMFSDPTDVFSVQLERAGAPGGPWAGIPSVIGSEGSLVTALDTDAPAGITSYYRLRYTDASGRSLTTGLAAAARLVAAPTRLALAAPKPNPTSAGTQIAFSLARPEFVRLTVTDASGRRVRTVHEGMLAPGAHMREWDGRTDGATPAPAGVYFIQLGTSGGNLTQRVSIMR